MPSFAKSFSVFSKGSVGTKRLSVGRKILLTEKRCFNASFIFLILGCH